MQSAESKSNILIQPQGKHISQNHGIFKRVADGSNLFYFEDLFKNDVNPNIISLLPLSEYTFYDLLEMLGSTQELKQSIETAGALPKLLTIKVSCALTTSMARVLLREVEIDNWPILNYSEKESVYSVRSVEINPGSGTTEVIFNINKFAYLYTEVGFCDMFGSRRGMFQFSQSSVLPEWITSITYALSTANER